MQKSLLIIFFLACATLASATTTPEIESLWEAWKTFYGKTYSSLEEVARFGIFSHNYKKIVKFNQENDTPKLAVNKFADLSSDEFRQLYASSGFYESDSAFVQERTQEFNVGALPDSVDWRSKGAVTPVKDEKQCDSAWAFSTTGVLEGFFFINNGTLLSLSAQQIIDCDTTNNQGCGGGWPYLGIQYAAQNGLETDTDYPYNAQQNSCTYDKTKAVSMIATNYSFVTANSTDQLKNALVSSPVSVLIEADQDQIQFYKSGVIVTGCGATLNHAVLAVGYHKVGLLEAFIVKNSWGADWGEAGYIQIWTNGAQNGKQGVCGILAQPVVATK